ncbi:MAG: hypothetical protein ABFS12_16330 [Bacteroidota bacterium]
MRQSFFTKFILLIIALLLFDSCSGNFTIKDRDIRYIYSRINTAGKASIILQDGTIWGFGHFVVNSPGDKVIVTYYESSLGGSAYIHGVEQSVSYLGTTYSDAGSVNDIIKFSIGKMSYISNIDSTGTVITLDDSTKWIVRPDQREGIKKWDNNENIIIDSINQLIINPRLYEMAVVQEFNEGK